MLRIARLFCLFSILSVFAGFSWAETIDVKGVDTQSEAPTTIEIYKDRHNGHGLPNMPLWEVHDGTADLEGDSSALNKEARQSWKKSCQDWKKEFREDNKENKVINISCGSPTCSGPVGGVICTSKAIYKIKTRLDK